MNTTEKKLCYIPHGSDDLFLLLRPSVRLPFPEETVPLENDETDSSPAESQISKSNAFILDFPQIPQSYIYGIFPISRSQVVHSPPPQGTPTDGFSCFDSSPLSVETWITFQEPESFRGCSTCWGKCGRGPDRAQPGHRDPRPPPPVSVAVLVSYAHCHRASWATNWTNRYKSQQILPHLLSCSSSRPLKSPASNSCWVAQLLPRRAGTKQSLVDNHENQSLHSAVRKDIRAGKWIFASPQMYSILRVFFWPFLQSLLSSKGDFSDANDFIVIVEKAQEEFPLQTSRT